ncbi:pheromone-processing carboxypeptidase KEX1-like [Vespa crabro]|uniref:pheromone-processing carboxypeptidase KEX1-like n=1 Tax=Vespa crabro TaxID=7445 RepID=UPI001F0045F3|nr:pheromone-processing carboxypeptidase KEX1-like [Vespa crabro]
MTRRRLQTLFARATEMKNEERITKTKMKTKMKTKYNDDHDDADADADADADDNDDDTDDDDNGNNNNDDDYDDDGDDARGIESPPHINGECFCCEYFVRGALVTCNFLQLFGQLLELRVM